MTTMRVPVTRPPFQPGTRHAAALVVRASAGAPGPVAPGASAAAGLLAAPPLRLRLYAFGNHFPLVVRHT
jgi:hypothetical protein